MIAIYTGIPGSGKSLKLADTILMLLHRNYKIYQKTGILRRVVSNLKLNQELSLFYKDFIVYWNDPAELISLRDVDVIWDEIATHLDSTQWQNIPLDLKRWLQQHRKLGIDIYGTTQDFAMIDVSMRRMTQELRILKKIIGSRDKSSTRPDPKYIWGVVLIRSLNPQDYKEDQKMNKASGLGLLLITRELTSVYDTRQEIEVGIYPPLNHIERVCIKDDCAEGKHGHKFKRVIHA